MRCTRILLPVCLLIVHAGMAQYDTLTLPFRALTIEDGLSQGMVNCIIQDKYGFMWFATKDGLNRYDGYSFTVFRHDPQDTTTVRDNTIEEVYEDRAGLIWVGTNTGLDVFDPRTEVFHHFSCGPASSPPLVNEGSLTPIGGDQCATRAITEDAAGHLWVSLGQGLYRIDPDRSGSSPAGPGARVDLVGICPGEKMHGMAVDASGLLRGAWKLNGAELDVRTFTLDTRDEARIAAMIADPQLLPWGRIVTGQGPGDWAAFITDTTRHFTYSFSAAVLETRDDANTVISTTALSDPGWMNVNRATTDAHGAIWAADHRLWRCDLRTGRVTRLIPASPDLRIEALKVVYLYRDRSGVLWVGTNGFGVLLYDPRGEPFHTQRLHSMRMMAPLRDGRMFAFTWSAFVYIFEEPFITPFPIHDYGNERDPGAYEPCVVEEGRGVLWSNIEDALTRYDEHDGSSQRFDHPDLPVRFPLHMQGDTLISFGSTKAFGRFNTRTKRFSSIPYPIPAEGGSFEFVQAIDRDAQGIFWLGTMKGLLRLDPSATAKSGQAGAWTHYASDPGDPRSLSTDVIFCLLDDPLDPGILWVGTNGGGLNKLDKRTGKVRRYTTEHGLPNNVVYGILADDDGQLWMSTNKGLSCFDPRTGSFRNYDAGDGLQSNEFNRYAYCKQADGTLFFGGVKGFNYFHPRDLAVDSTASAIHITRIKLINKAIDHRLPGSPLSSPAYLSAGMTIPHSTNMVTFEFASMEFSAPEEHRYQYKLDGFDNGWIMAGTDRSAVYTNLDPGTYTFRVRGDNRDGLWDTKGTAFRLVVLPPWWRTWWAYVIYAAAIIGGVLLFIRMRTAGLKRQKEHLERTVEQRTAELHQQKEHAEQLRARAEHSEQIKQQFLANMSHEIRTPMNAIMGMGNALHRNPHLPEQEPVIDAITSSSKNLLVIVNDILDLSKIEAGSMRLEKVPMDPRAAVHDVMEVLRFRAEESGLKMEVDIAPDVPARVLGDPTRLNQVLLNLVGNATKFSERGRVNVSVRVKEHLTDAVMLHFSITDTGIGIAPDRLPFIFDEFTQAETEHTRIYGGTGLGLTICKRLVEMQGGTISATSTPGQGSCFTFTIPYSTVPIVAAVTKPNDRRPTTDNTSTGLHDLRILLAEDNKMNVMVAKQELKHAIPGARIDVAANGQLAVEMVGLNDYDLVLMDVRMPVMDGFAATRAIRALGGDKSRIPIVAMTANVLGQGSECTAAGMDAYVPKPIQSEVLVARLREVLQH
jgi:signal transduction histidine kinase/ligand-binding sensor domain-containing protein/CheY-like chemotaxis protein